MKIKVLMIGPDRSVHGGISGVVNNYYEAGLDRKVDLYYIGTMVDGSKFRKLGQAIKAYLLFLIKLSGYDIVHVNMASDSSYYRKSVFIRTAKAFRKKIVIHQHGGNFREFYTEELSERGRKNLKKVFSMGDILLVLGSVWKEFFAAMVDEEKITVLSNSIVIPEYPEKKYGFYKILFLGRLCKEKGIEELLTVMPKLRETCPDVHLYLGGVWEDKGLKDKATGLASCVTDLGWIGGEEKKKYLQECDIFVLPSYFEGQPVSILEAMTYACGIVTTDTGSIPDMITDRQTGLLIPPGDAKALESSLLTMLTDTELCRQLGENARRKVEKDFSIEDNIKKLLDIYEKMVQKERSPEA